jgi:hypothetical protein
MGYPDPPGLNMMIGIFFLRNRLSRSASSRKNLSVSTGVRLTRVSRQIASQSQYDAFYTDYAATLLHVLGEMNIQTAARYLNLSFNAAWLDAHTLVELLNLDTGDWILLDPTFSLSAKRSDGEWASAEGVSQATLAFDWQAISYVFLGAAGDSYARGYYLDYSLLYVKVYHQGQPFVVGQGPLLLQYLQVTTLPTKWQPRRLFSAMQQFGEHRGIHRRHPQASGV